MQAASSWERQREAVTMGELSPSLPSLLCCQRIQVGTSWAATVPSAETQTPSDFLQWAAVVCVGSAPPALGWDLLFEVWLCPRSTALLVGEGQ